jgi:hypothetical protein
VRVSTAPACCPQHCCMCARKRYATMLRVLLLASSFCMCAKACSASVTWNTCLTQLGYRQPRYPYIITDIRAFKNQLETFHFLLRKQNGRFPSKKWNILRYTAHDQTALHTVTYHESVPSYKQHSIKAFVCEETIEIWGTPSRTP